MSKLRVDQIETIDGLNTKDVSTIVDDINTVQVTTAKGDDTLPNSLDSRVTKIQDINELLSLTTSNISTNQMFEVLSYHPSESFGGGLFYWDSSLPQTNHNGGTIIAESAVFPTDWSVGTQVDSWFDGNSLVGNGCFVRKQEGPVDVKAYGAKATSGFDDTKSIQQAFTSEDSILFSGSGTYSVTSAITFSENQEISVFFDGNASVDGLGYLPRLRSNPEHRISSQYKRSFKDKTSFDDSKHAQVNALDGISTVDNSVGNFKNLVTFYAGADSSGAVEPRIWAINTVTNVHKGHSGVAEAYGYELDVNLDVDSTGESGVIAGLYLAGIGDMSTSNQANAIWIRRDGSRQYQWKEGVKIEEAVDGVVVDDSVSRYSFLSFRSPSQMKIVPPASDGTPVFLVNDPTDINLTASINRDGGSSFSSIAVGGGDRLTSSQYFYAPSVGTGSIAANSYNDLLFTTIFGAHTLSPSVNALTITPATAGVMPDVTVSLYYDKTAGDYKVRIKNNTAASIGNFGIDLSAKADTF